MGDFIIVQLLSFLATKLLLTLVVHTVGLLFAILGGEKCGQAYMIQVLSPINQFYSTL
jgi:hypothetical protein